MGHMREGDKIFFTSYPLPKSFAPGKASAWYGALQDWLWLLYQPYEVWGIEHLEYGTTPPEWKKLVLTTSPYNPIDSVGVYYQIEGKVDPQEFQCYLPDPFVVTVGHLQRLQQNVDLAAMKAVRESGYSVVIVGVGGVSYRRYARKLGITFPNLEEPELSYILSRAAGVMFSSGKRSMDYIQKISGSFPLSVQHGKALICDPAFREAHSLENTVSPYDVSPDSLARAAAATPKVEQSQLASNESLFTRIMS